MPDTQNSPCAFLALSPSVAFTPTRVTLQLSFWRPGCILYYFPLFLLTLPCRPLSDTSSLSVLLHCVLVEEDLWAGSRHPKKYSSLFSFFFFLPPLARLALGSEKIWSMAVCFFNRFPPVLSCTFECPLPFFILSFCLFLLQHWQSVCFFMETVLQGCMTSETDQLRSSSPPYPGLSVQISDSLLPL